MKWADIQFNPTRKVLRQFSGAWLVFFLAWGMHQWLVAGNERVSFFLGIIAVVVGFFGLILPQAVRLLYIGCTMIAFPIGWVVSHTLLAFMFYCIITPIGLFLKMRSHDLLSRKPSPQKESFWIPKKAAGDLRNYLRQY